MSQSESPPGTAGRSAVNPADAGAQASPAGSASADAGPGRSSPTAARVAVFKDLVLSLAVLIGGGWTLYRFVALDEVERARASLEAQRRALYERGVLEISIHPSQIPSGDEQWRLVVVVVQLQNEGNRTELLEWSKSELRSSRVVVEEDGTLDFRAQRTHRYSLPHRPAVSDSILPGETLRVPFLVPLKAPGVYQFLFRAQVSEPEQAEAREEHAAVGAPLEAYFWRAVIYFRVE